MSGSTDPLLKSMEVPLTDNEMSMLNKGKCPNCQDFGFCTEGLDFTEPNLRNMKMEYFIKCGSCLTDYTVYLDVRHVTHIVTYKNGERIRPCPEKISKIAQSKKNETSIKNTEKPTSNANNKAQE